MRTLAIIGLSLLAISGCDNKPEAPMQTPSPHTAQPAQASSPSSGESSTELIKNGYLITAHKMAGHVAAFFKPAFFELPTEEQERVCRILLDEYQMPNFSVYVHRSDENSDSAKLVSTYNGLAKKLVENKTSNQKSNKKKMP